MTGHDFLWLGQKAVEVTLQWLMPLALGALVAWWKRSRAQNAELLRNQAEMQQNQTALHQKVDWLTTAFSQSQAGVSGQIDELRIALGCVERTVNEQLSAGHRELRQFRGRTTRLLTRQQVQIARLQERLANIVHTVVDPHAARGLETEWHRQDRQDQMGWTQEEAAESQAEDEESEAGERRP